MNIDTNVDPDSQTNGPNSSKESIAILTRGIQAFQSKVSEHFLLTENIFRELKLMCVSAMTCTTLNEAFDMFEKIQKTIEQKQQSLRESYQSLPEVLARSFFSSQPENKPSDSTGSSPKSIEDETKEFKTQGLNLIKEYKSILNDIKEKNRTFNKLYESPLEDRKPSGQVEQPKSNNQKLSISNLGLGSVEKHSPASPFADQSFHQVLDNIAAFMRTWESKAEDQTQRLDLINKELHQIKMQMEPYQHVRGMKELLQTIEAQQKDLNNSIQLSQRAVAKENSSNFLNQPLDEYSSRHFDFHSKNEERQRHLTNTVRERFDNARKHIESLRQEQTPAKSRFEALKEESYKLIYKTDRERQQNVERRLLEKELSEAKQGSQKELKWEAKNEYQSSDYIRNNSAEKYRSERSPWRSRRRLVEEPEKYYVSDYLREKSREKSQEERERVSTRIKPRLSSDDNDYDKYIAERKEEIFSAKQKYSDHQKKKRTAIHNEISQLDKEIKIITELIQSAAKK